MPNMHFNWFQRRLAEDIARENVSNPQTGNELIRVQPTLRAKPANRTGVAYYTSTSLSGDGAMEIDLDMIDPCTGLPTVRCTLPAGSTNYKSIMYEDLDEFTMGHEDVWFISVWLPDRLTNTVIQLLVADTTSIAGVEYRIYTASGNTTQLQKGWNVIQMLHVETRVDTVTYGTVGTTAHGEWTNNGTHTDDSSVQSLTLRCRFTSGQSADQTIYLGSVHTAPAGWAKAAVMWMFDDVPLSIYNKIVPIIESYGWKYSIAAASGYAADPGSGANEYTSTSVLRTMLKNENEIWNHSMTHENFDTASSANKIRSIDVSSAFWAANNFNQARRLFAWPFGAYDYESVTLLRDKGYLLARSIHGDSISPFSAGINPYWINCFSIEQENSWRVDTMLNGNIKRGMGMITYAHTAIDGGEGSDTYPGAVSFYVDHFKRWCELVARYENDNKVVVTTPIKFFKMCGIDVFTHKFYE